MDKHWFFLFFIRKNKKIKYTNLKLEKPKCIIVHRYILEENN